MAETCSHCGSADVQAQLHTYQCLNCGQLTRISDKAPVKREKQYLSPSPLERRRIADPNDPFTYDEWAESLPEQGDVRVPRVPVGDQPTWLPDEYTAVGDREEAS